MANLEFKIIKVTEFTFDEENHTHYVLGRNGRVYSFSSLVCGDDVKHTVKDNVLTITSDVQVEKSSYSDFEGNKKVSRQLFPAEDIETA